MPYPFLPHRAVTIAPSSASPHRIQANIVARAERATLDWLCARMPAWVEPDHLTLVGIAGSVLVVLGYGFANFTIGFVWLASLGLVVHWFGDSLDGSLARWRGIERPRYGYFVDHGLDAFCNTLNCIGIGLGPFVRMDVALFALAGYLLLTLFVMLKDKAMGSFQLSFHGFGPTELRLCLIVMNAAMVVLGPLSLAPSLPMTAYDLLIGAGAAAFLAIFVAEFTRLALALRRDGR